MAKDVVDAENLLEDVKGKKFGISIQNIVAIVTFLSTAIAGWYSFTGRIDSLEEVVTGLLTGQDLLKGLRGVDLGDQLLLPSVMLRQDHHVFLDDMTLEEVSRKLGVPILVVRGADDIVAAAMGDREEIL